MKSSPTLAQLAEFDEIIDVRTPSEFRIDHVPGAKNVPVLDDMERASVGTLYAKDSFAAKKLGAALISRNIAKHLETAFAEKPKSWRPLVYCWRGGKRSGAMSHILAEIGWRSAKLEGGYKAYRRQVIEMLEILPAQFSFRVICGETGCGKSRLLDSLARGGAQVLDLEGLAKHRGSVLGSIPGEDQPSQKYFESLLWQALSGFDAGEPVYVESESRKIGEIRVPQALIEAMWKGKCVRIGASLEVRTEILLQDYGHFLTDTETLDSRLQRLQELYGRETIDSWKKLAHEGKWAEFVRTLLDKHYDLSYRKSMLAHYPDYPEIRPREATCAHPACFDKLAAEILDAAD